MPRVAVVDTDQAFLGLMQEIIGLRGWSCVTLVGGADACAVLPRERPDLIVLELWLESPDSGWQIVRHLRAHPTLASTPVMICTGALDWLRSYQDRLAGEGIPVLVKPFDLEEFYRLAEASFQRR